MSFPGTVLSVAFDLNQVDSYLQLLSQTRIKLGLDGGDEISDMFES